MDGKKQCKEHFDGCGQWKDPIEFNLKYMGIRKNVCRECEAKNKTAGK
jgi:hypothetical protein